MDLVENGSIDIHVKRHPWELARYSIILEKVKRMLAEVPYGIQPVLVDIGCGDAFVVQQLYHEFASYWITNTPPNGESNVIAIDINFTPENINTLKTVNDQVCYLQDITELTIDKECAYIVLLNDVIEHIDDHNGFIKILDRHFAGVALFELFITVPAYQHLFSNHDIDLGHFRRYKVSQVKDYARDLNMEISESGYFFFSLFLARSIVKLFEPPIDVNRQGIGVSAWKGGPLATVLFKTMLKTDYAMGSALRKLGIDLPGLSTYIVMKR
jgi:hypothetical protein